MPMTGRLRVLIAEDETIIRLDLRTMLQRASRELGRKPPDERPLDVVVVGRGESRWPLRITRDPNGRVEVSLLREEPEGR